MAWLYIEPIRPTTPDEPASDPVDSDPVTMLLSPNRRSDPSGVLLPHLKLWPFSLAWPVQVKHSRNRAYPRCGLSATYHCMPLTSFLSQNTNKVVQMISWTFYKNFLILYFCIIFEGKRFLFTGCFGFYIFSTYLWRSTTYSRLGGTTVSC